MSLLVLNGQVTATQIQNGDLKLDSLTDVDLTPDTLTVSQDGHILKFNGTTLKFENVDIDTLVGDELTEIEGGTYS